MESKDENVVCNLAFRLCTEADVTLGGPRVNGKADQSRGVRAGFGGIRWVRAAR